MVRWLLSDRTRLMRSAWLVIGLVLASAGAASAQEVVPGRLIVRYRSPRPIAEHVLGGTVVRGVRRLTPDTHVVTVAGSTEEALDRLRASGEVIYAEPDYVRQRYGVTPNDPMYPNQWGLPAVKASQAWSQSTGSPDVTVAIVDSGIRPHPDLKARLLPGYDFISDPSNAGDGDGRDADPTDAGDSSESSSALHGMHVTGIIGASSNNGAGVAGVDWACKLLPVRVLGVHSGTGVDSDIADAIRWAAGVHVDGVPDNPRPAQVINMSFGGHGLSQTMQDAITEANAKGAAVVAAAGNLNVDASSDSPAGLKGVITVGAVDPTGQIASYSNYGRVVALMAPGGQLGTDAKGNAEGILSTLELPQTGFTYVYYAGTSQAAPFVSGAIALMKAVAPSTTPADAKKLLMASADASARCPDPVDATLPGCGAGLLDIDAALTLASVQADCQPGCDGQRVCAQGVCVSASSIGGGQVVAQGNVSYGGCALSGRLPRRAPFGLVALLAVGLGGLVSRRRSRV